MIHISLGKHCDISYNIKKYINNDIPTQFFDNLRTDFKCILYILKLINIELILNLENIIVDKETYNESNDVAISFKNFKEQQLTLLSRHDIQLRHNENNEELNNEELNNKLIEFINTYKRRFERLISLITSDNKLCFIYRVPEIDYNLFNFNDNIEEFNKVLCTINKNIKYCLIILVNSPEDYIYIKKKDCLNINISTFIDTTIQNDWTNNHYDWDNIFNIIKKNTF
jgi:hypothetical protein